MMNQFEQSLAQFRDVIPRIYWNLYQGCLEQGFDKTQSFTILQMYIIGSNTSIRPNERQGPNSDNPNNG